MDKPVRVLQVVGTMDFGGVEILLMNIYRQIDREQVQFDFLCHNSMDCEFTEEIKKLGGRMYVIPGPGHGGMQKYRHTLYRFFCDHPEYTIIHCHKSDMNGLILEQAKKAGVKYRISHAHTSDPRYGSLISSLVAKWSKSKINPSMTHAFACSQGSADYVYQKDPYVKDCYILHNGIHVIDFQYNEEKRMAIRSQYGWDASQFVIGHVGKFTKFKNQSFIVKVFEEVLKKRPEARLLLVGTGVTEQEVKEQVDAAGLGESVVFAGSQSDIPAYMSAMDVFLFPSIYEGLPVVTVEAQAAGLPVVYSDVLTEEIKISDLCTTASLNQSPAEWAEILLQYQPSRPREEYTGVIEQSDYNIEKVAKELQKTYLLMV